MLIILTFNINKFCRSRLDKMSNIELYGLAMSHSNEDTMIYTVSDFCDLCNDQEIDIGKWWIYTANV